MPARCAVVVADVWKTTPFMALLILAGLQMIPADVYEAAKVDGATAWQRFRMITLPLVKPALMVAVLFRTMDALRMFDLPAIMMGGIHNTTTLSVLVVDQITSAPIPPSALSTITFLIIFAVAFILVRFLGANVVEQHAGEKQRNGEQVRGARQLDAAMGGRHLHRRRPSSCLGTRTVLLDDRDGVPRPSADTFSTSLVAHAPHAVQLHARRSIPTRQGELHPGTDEQPHHRRAVTTLIALVVGVFTAYALSRFDFRGKYFVTGIILGASMFPVVALVTPLFQLFTDIGWIGSYKALIIPNISFVLPLTVYTLTSFFSELPWELEEAARIDGATRGQAFRLIMLPLAAPALFTTAILAFIATVNEYLLSLQLSSDKTAPVTVAMAKFSGTDPFVTPYTSIMAGGTLVMIPLVIMVLHLPATHHRRPDRRRRQVTAGQ